MVPRDSAKLGTRRPDDSASGGRRPSMDRVPGTTHPRYGGPVPAWVRSGRMGVRGNPEADRQRDHSSRGTREGGETPGPPRWPKEASTASFIRRPGGTGLFQALVGMENRARTDKPHEDPEKMDAPGTASPWHVTGGHRYLPPERLGRVLKTLRG